MKRGRTYSLKDYAAKRRRAIAAVTSVVAPRRSNLGRRRINARTGGFVGIELKFYDVGKTLTTIANGGTTMAGCEFDAGTVDDLASPAQGDGESNRDGRTITIKSIEINGIVKVAAQADQTATDNSMVVKFWLVRDKQTNGAQLNSEDVLTNAFAATANAVCAMKNIEYDKRFQILATRTIRVPTLPITFDGTNIEQGGVTIPWSMKKRMTCQVNWKAGATTAGVTGVLDNSFHLIATTDSTTNIVQAAYNSRIRFVG